MGWSREVSSWASRSTSRPSTAAAAALAEAEPEAAGSAESPPQAASRAVTATAEARRPVIRSRDDDDFVTISALYWGDRLHTAPFAATLAR